MIAFGADLKVVDGFRLTPYDKLMNQEGPLRTLMESLLADPGFINRYEANGPLLTRQMLLYYKKCLMVGMFGVILRNPVYIDYENHWHITINLSCLLDMLV